MTYKKNVNDDFTPISAYNQDSKRKDLIMFIMLNLIIVLKYDYSELQLYFDRILVITLSHILDVQYLKLSLRNIILRLKSF